MDVIVALLPLVFWAVIIGLITYFIVKKVKKSNARRDAKIEELEKQVNKDE
ncbi:hypothetical protein GCM10007063_16640 [Lentibacillus kapialis]|uniref:Uncharacterized protein n=1 Tax=Lentibacillus kapialis TaxID=340214 RepID=A0A917PW55_9BACI|nr:hypothetical protein [Lentibacillus kapialis]GGJ94773.1 hypothetical protein GCM10007063_16640 [Lentibacillus kapialis]